MTFEFNELKGTSEERARIEKGDHGFAKQTLLVEDSEDFDNHFWHLNRTRLKQLGYGNCNCIRCLLHRSGVDPEDARGIPAKVPTEAEWRRSWIDWAKREKNAAIDKTFEGLSIEELQEQATQALHEWIGRNPLLPKGHFGIGKSALVERKWRNECDALIARRDELIKRNALEEQAIEELAEEEVENARLDK